MEAHKSHILDRYGYLRKELALSKAGYPKVKMKPEQLKLEMAKVTFDMEMNDLSHEDYVKYRDKKGDQASEQFDAQLKAEAKKSLEKGIAFMGVGLALVLAGISWTIASNFSVLFYGLVLTGTALMVFGGFELYLYREQRNTGRR